MSDMFNILSFKNFFDKIPSRISNEQNWMVVQI